MKNYLSHLTTKKLMIALLPILFLCQTLKAQELLAMNTSGELSGPTLRDNGAVVTNIASDKDDDTLSAQKTAKPNFPSTISMAKANNMVHSYFLGMDDADYNYRAKKSTTATVFITTLIGGPVVGVIPAMAFSAVVPNNTSLNLPTSELVTDDAYMRGYKTEATYIKRHCTWPRYVLASIIWLAAANLILR